MWGWLRRKKRIDSPARIQEPLPAPARNVVAEGRDERVEALRHALGFRYYQHNGKWYAQFKGTIWTLEQEDLEAIVKGEFNTPKTKEIYASIFNIMEKARRHPKKHL